MKYPITITVDIPDELLAALRAAGSLARAAPSPPPSPVPAAGREPGEHDIEPEHRPPASAPNGQARAHANGRHDDTPRSGKQFLGWLKKQRRETFQAATKIAKAWGFPTMFIQLSPDQAVELYVELTAGQPGPAGSRRWGG